MVRTADLLAQPILSGANQLFEGLTRGFLERRNIQEARSERERERTAREQAEAARAAEAREAAARQAAFQALQMAGGAPGATRGTRGAGGLRADVPTFADARQETVHEARQKFHAGQKTDIPTASWLQRISRNLFGTDPTITEGVEPEPFKDTEPPLTLAQRRADMVEQSKRDAAAGQGEAPFDPQRALAFAEMLHGDAPEHVDRFLLAMGGPDAILQTKDFRDWAQSVDPQTLDFYLRDRFGLAGEDTAVGAGDLQAPPPIDPDLAAAISTDTFRSIDAPTEGIDMAEWAASGRPLPAAYGGSLRPEPPAPGVGPGQLMRGLGDRGPAPSETLLQTLDRAVAELPQIEERLRASAPQRHERRMADAAQLFEQMLAERTAPRPDTTAIQPLVDAIARIQEMGRNAPPADPRAQAEASLDRIRRLSTRQ